MRTFFFTGFPGFLGSELIQKLLPELADVRALCLVQKKFVAQAEKMRAEIVSKHPTLTNRIQITEGDITLPDLGLTSTSIDRNSIVQIFHLAAVYDLSVARDLAYRINVEGTLNILNFAKSLPGLERFQYVSTCYVSGKYAGIYRENDLDVGQKFNNFYEETKFLAEVEVRRFGEQGLPFTTYRPAIVVGNSETGETQKFDGPYFVMQWLLRQPKTFAVLPSLGDPNAFEINVVPSDFVIRSIAYLSQQKSSVGKTFQLADPKPLTIREIVETLGKATGRRVISLPLPAGLAKFSVAYVPGIESFLKIPASTLDYFVHPTRYATAETQAALAGSGIKIPGFRTYAQTLVDFMKKHPSIRSKAMI